MQAVESSSSLFQSALLAALYLITGVHIPTLGRVMSIAFGVATLFSTYRLIRLIGCPYALSGTALLAVSFPFLYWTFGGLETTIFGFFLTWVMIELIAFVHALKVTSLLKIRLLVLLITFLTIRPESGLLMICGLVGYAGLIAAQYCYSGVWRRRRLRVFLIRISISLLVTVLVFGLLMVWRHARFGIPFPQASYVKGSYLSLAVFLEGLAYIVLSGNSSMFFMVMKGCAIFLV